MGPLSLQERQALAEVLDASGLPAFDRARERLRSLPTQRPMVRAVAEVLFDIVRPHYEAAP